MCKNDTYLCRGGRSTKYNVWLSERATNERVNTSLLHDLQLKLAAGGMDKFALEIRIGSLCLSFSSLSPPMHCTGGDASGVRCSRRSKSVSIWSIELWSGAEKEHNDRNPHPHPLLSRWSWLFAPVMQQQTPMPCNRWSECRSPSARHARHPWRTWFVDGSWFFFSCTRASPKQRPPLGVGIVARKWSSGSETASERTNDAM